MDNTAFVAIAGLRKGRQAVSQVIETAAAGGCGTTGGEGKASCGSSATCSRRRRSPDQ